MSRFGKELYELRVEQRVTLRDLSKATGYDSSNWSKVERGVISPPLGRELNKALRFLGLDYRAHSRMADLAFIAARRLPKDLPEEDLLKVLPIPFCPAKAEKIIKARLRDER